MLPQFSGYSVAMDRRLFVFSAAAAAVPLYAGPAVILSSDEVKFLEALVDQIIPPDDAPGAAQAGVVFYIDKQLAGPYKRLRDNYRRGIPAFRTACVAKTGKDFLALTFPERTDYLRFDGSPFFTMVLEHTMQGYYGSPEHGGNLNDASWKMLDIEHVMGGHSH
jgi:gluconate 2-dehydrogenase gamma chain